MLLVIFNHTGTRGYMLYTVSMDSVFYPFYMLISVACKVAVPLYFMVSGALLLPKEESIKKVYCHRILRMVIVLILYSAVTYVWQILTGRIEGGFDLKYFIEKIFSSQFATAYWFIYAYIGMLVMLPLLRKLVKSMSANEFYYLFSALLLLYGIVPILMYFYGQGSVWLNANVTENLFTYRVLYFIEGYYFGYVLKDEDLTRKKMLIWIGAAVAAVILTCIVTQYRIDVTGLSDPDNAETFYGNLLPIPVFALFYTIRYWFIHHQAGERSSRIIITFGSAAFGIMLIEEMLRFETEFIYTSLFPILHSLVSCLIWVSVIYLCGAAITLCLKRIPGMKKLI